MAAVASSPRPALDASSTTHVGVQPQQGPPRLLLRLPAQPETDGHRHPLKRKWRSIVNFFALPIRSYYLEPPGLAYRNQLRERRGHLWADNDEQASFWPCPAYTDQVGDDEMVLFKAQEEAEAFAAIQRDQQAAAREEERAQVSEGEVNDGSSDDDDEDEGQQVEQLASPRGWSQTLSVVAALPIAAAEPSPQYEHIDPLSTFSSSPSPSAAQPIPTAQRPRLRVRTRTTSNLTPSSHQPAFINGITMSRQHSTPLSPTLPFSSSTPPTSRRSRAQTNATRPSISEPLSWTLVRSQYSYPKRGLTAQQLAFLSSVESLGRFGVQSDVAPSPAYQEGGDYGFPSVEG